MGPIVLTWHRFKCCAPVDQNPMSPSAVQWKAEVEARKKSKSYINPQRPDQPLKLGSTPEWKKQLQEKTKMKRSQSTDEDGQGLTMIVSPGVSHVISTFCFHLSNPHLLRRAALGTGRSTLTCSVWVDSACHSPRDGKMNTSLRFGQ